MILVHFEVNDDCTRYQWTAIALPNVLPVVLPVRQVDQIHPNLILVWSYLNEATKLMMKNFGFDFRSHFRLQCFRSWLHLRYMRSILVEMIMTSMTTPKVDFLWLDISKP